MTQPLRVAALVRVSSPAQAKADKTSLLVQEEMIKLACANIGATIVRVFKGVESATKGKAGGDKQRTILAALLAAAAERPRPFDAVMVYDTTRWSRDTEEALRTRRELAERGVKFYVREFPLGAEDDDPIEAFKNTIDHAQAQLETDRTRRRFRLGKLGAAKLGHYPMGPKPYGRTYDHETHEWGINKDEVAKIRRAYKLIVERGYPMSRVAAEMGNTTLAWHKRLRSAARDWVGCTLKDEAFRQPIAPLLSAEQMQRLEDAWAAPRTRGVRSIGSDKTGNPAYQYALSGKVKCMNCGDVLQGTYKNGHRQYKHYHSVHWQDGKCLRSADAQRAEYAVFNALGQALLNRKSIADTITASLDDRAQERDVLLGNMQASIKDRDAHKKAEEDLMEKTSVASLRDPAQKKRFEAKMARHAEGYAGAEEQVQRLQLELEALAARKDHAQRAAQFIELTLGKWAKYGISKLPSWPMARKRQLIDMLFGEGSLSQKRALRHKVGIFLKRDPRDAGERSPRFVIDRIETLVPLFDDATLRELARRLEAESARNPILNVHASTSQVARLPFRLRG